MKNFYVCLIVLFVLSCSTSPVPVKETTPAETPVPAGEIKKEHVVPSIKTGWADEDSYTVVVVAENVERARDAAKHRILKDIVTVRVSNGSRYTDIAGIQDEFRKPFEGGRILSERRVSDGVEIYYQINDKGLKKKFERK